MNLSQNKKVSNSKNIRNTQANIISEYIFFSYDLSGRIIKINKKALQVYQFTREEITGIKVNRFFHKESYGIVTKQLKFNEFYSGTIISNKKNGEAFLSHVQIFSDYNKHRELSGYSVFARDVTAQESQALYHTDSEERYHSLFNDANVGIARIDLLTGNFLECNDYLRKLVGLRKHEVLNKKIQDVIFSAENNLPAELNSFIENVFSEYYCWGKKSEKKYLEISSTTIYSTQKLPLYLLLVLHDVTEINNQKTELLLQNAKLKAVFQSPSHIIWTINNKYEVTSYNANFLLEMKGKQQKIKKENRKEKLVFSQKMPSFSLWNEKYKQAFQYKSQHFEFKIQRANKTALWREVYLEPIVNSAGKVIEVFGIAHDITQKKKNEIEIQRALKEKEVLLREIHHRVKNNMQVISSILNLQTSFIKDEAMIKVLQDCQARIKSMAFVHENLYLSGNFSEINARDYLTAIAKSLFHSYRLSEKNIELELKLDDIILDLDHSIPCGLIINELMSNALKYAFKNLDFGKITLAFYIRKQTIHLCVKDNGCGIPEHINFQNPNTLGLQLVSTLAEQLGAELVLNTRRGTSFLITFTLLKKNNLCRPLVY
jgi:PAS domain S-box-containing protein